MSKAKNHIKTIYFLVHMAIAAFHLSVCTRGRPFA